MSGLPRKRVVHSGLMTQVISARGCASWIAATAGNVWTMSPSELGLMIKMEWISDFRLQTADWTEPNLQSAIYNLQSLTGQVSNAPPTGAANRP